MPAQFHWMCDSDVLIHMLFILVFVLPELPVACTVHLLRQSTVHAVQNLAETHKTALNFLKTLASCLSTEAQQWMSNIAALTKAKAEEEKAIDKARKQAEKAENKRKERAAKAAAKAAQKEAEKAQKAAEAADALENPEEAEAEVPEAEERKTRKPKTVSQELSEEDYMVLHTGSNPKMPAQYAAAVIKDTVAAFVNHIVDSPHLISVVRFKRNAVKKVLQDRHVFSSSLTTNQINQQKHTKHILTNSLRQ